MRRLFVGLGCAMGLAWLFRRRRRGAPEPAADPAEELRRKLDESRATDPPTAAPASSEPEAPLDERRRRVHERGRAAIESMREASPPDADPGRTD